MHPTHTNKYFIIIILVPSQCMITHRLQIKAEHCSVSRRSGPNTPKAPRAVIWRPLCPTVGVTRPQIFHVRVLYPASKSTLTSGNIRDFQSRGCSAAGTDNGPGGYFLQICECIPCRRVVVTPNACTVHSPIASHFLTRLSLITTTHSKGLSLQKAGSMNNSRVFYLILSQPASINPVTKSEHVWHHSYGTDSPTNGESTCFQCMIRHVLRSSKVIEVIRSHLPRMTQNDDFSPDKDSQCFGVF